MIDFDAVSPDRLMETTRALARWTRLSGTAEERAAFFGSAGFHAPPGIQGTEILVNGLRLPYADLDESAGFRREHLSARTLSLGATTSSSSRARL